VTVIDPRHPLYDQNFPLLHIKNKQELVRSCLVQLTKDVERLIPVQVTDLAMSAPDIFPVPLDISSLHSLTQTFARIAAQLERECGDEGSRREQREGEENVTEPGLGNTDGRGAGERSEDRGLDLSGDGCTLEEGAEA